MIKITKYFITVETVIIIEVIAKELEVTEVIINFIIFASNLIYLEVEVIIVVITLYLEVITALDWSCQEAIVKLEEVSVVTVARLANQEAIIITITTKAIKYLGEIVIVVIDLLDLEATTAEVI